MSVAPASLPACRLEADATINAKLIPFKQERETMKTLKTVMPSAAAMMILFGSAHAADKHLFYMNGCCINKVGGGAYEAIVKELRNAGFIVVFDLRNDDSNATIQAEVAKVAGQVKILLDKGTAPEDITVSGYSLGSIETLLVSIAIANPKVNYVLLAGCPGSGVRSFDIDYAKVQGRVLSIIDTKDDKFGSCKERLPENVLQKEIAFDSGYGHAVFRYTGEKNMKLWREPLESWAKIK